MAAIAAALAGVIGSGIVSSQGASGASGAMQAGYGLSADQLKAILGDQNFLNLLSQTQNLQTMQGPVQNQLAANQLLGGMLGIGNLSPTTGTAFPGTTPGSLTSNVPGSPGYTPGTAATPSATQGPFNQNQLTLPSGQIVTMPQGYDLSSIYGPRTATPLNLTSGQATGLQGSLLSTGVSANDIQNYLGGSLDIMQQKGEAEIEAQALKSGTFGGGGMGTDLMSFLSGLYGEYAPTQAFNMKQQDLNRIFSTLQNYATGTPGTISSAAGTGAGQTASTTGQMGTTGTGIAQSLLGGQTAAAQGDIWQGNIWQGGVNNIGSILTKYLQNQPSSTGQNAFNTYWANEPTVNMGSSEPYGY
jgi:hypothetical protein